MSVNKYDVYLLDALFFKRIIYSFLNYASQRNLLNSNKETKFKVYYYINKFIFIYFE